LAPHHLVLAGVALIIIATFIAYLPSISGGFVLDDDVLLTENKLIKASDGPYRFWCTIDAPDYWPVTNNTFWIEWRLWDMNSTGYHVTNLILHIAEALLIWLILRKLSIPGAFLAAMIFAVHPVNVESVAWIASRKNMMAMLFFLLSILWYLKADMPTTSVGMAPARSHGGPWEREKNHSPLATLSSPHATRYCPLSTVHCPLFYWLSLAAFLLAMLSKGSVAMLPLLLLGIIWWLRPMGTVPIFAGTMQAWSAKMGLSPSSPFMRRDLLRIAPFFLVATVLIGVNLWFQTHGAEVVIRTTCFGERLLGAGGAAWFYLYKALLPIDLVFIYPQWHIDGGNLLWCLPLLAALTVTAVLWLYRKSWSRPFLFAWGFFCVALVPVMGFTDVGFMKYSLVADRYQHIAIIGVIALASAGVAAWHRLWSGAAAWAAMFVVIVAVGTLAFLTWRQSAHFSDEFALYRATLEKNPACWLVHYNLACALTQTGRPQEAIEHYEQALRLNPDYVEAHHNLGIMLSGSGRLREAIEHYEQAQLLRPNNPGIYFNLGNAFQGLGQSQQAIKYFEQALAINPDFCEAHLNLGLTLASAGRLPEAIEHYEQALRLKPDSPDVHYSLGNALKDTVQYQQAIEHYKKALQIKPDYFEACNNLAIALSMAGRPKEAVEYFQQALRLKSDYPEAHYNLGNVLFQTGRLIEAIEHYRQALKLRPDYTDAHANLGTALVQLGSLREAVEHYQRAIQLKNDFTEVYFNLATTYARMHESSEAIAMAEKALELARSQGQTELAEKIEKWLNSYRASLSAK